MIYRAFGKRLLDIACAAVAIALLSPILLVTAILVWFEDGKPILFRQIRMGANHSPFAIIKFRSMPRNTFSVASSEIGTPVVTKIGRVIRRLNIDELPQLVNILRGDMSIVGPRPALPSQIELVGLRDQLGVYSAKPGLTGLAQIRSYDGMSVEEKAAHDSEYAERITFRGDIAIIARTFGYLSKPPPTY